MGLREEKKQQQREAILETALRLFREHGVHQTKVQDVAEQLGISVKTFFNYFPTKQSVLEAAVVDMIAKSVELLKNAGDDRERTVPEQIQAFLQAVAEDFSGDREFAELLEVTTTMWLGGGPLLYGFQLLTELFEEGQRRGEIRDDVRASQLAELLSAAILVTISKWSIVPGDVVLHDNDADGDPLDERFLAAWRVFSVGIAPLERPQGVSRKRADIELVRIREIRKQAHAPS